MSHLQNAAGMSGEKWLAVNADGMIVIVKTGLSWRNLRAYTCSWDSSKLRRET